MTMGTSKTKSSNKVEMRSSICMFVPDDSPVNSTQVYAKKCVGECYHCQRRSRAPMNPVRGERASTCARHSGATVTATKATHETVQRLGRSAQDGGLLFADSLSSTVMSEVTRILSAIDQGDPSAAEQLLPLVYDELRKLAAAKLAQEKPGQTLQATALVHEAYVRLVDADRRQHWDGRGHFFAA